MQDIIQKLKIYEDNQLDNWYDLDERVSEQFIADVSAYAQKNEEKIMTYCQSISPDEFSSLSIVYEALSNDDKWNRFLFSEIVRVIELVKLEKSPITAIGILSDIDAENIYHDLPLYIELINYLVAQLDVYNTDVFNIGLLDLLDWFLMELFINDEIAEVSDWYDTIKNIHNYSLDLTVKRVARDAMRHLEDYKNVKKPSVLQELLNFYEMHSSLS